MTRNSAAADVAARRLWSRGTAGATPEAVAANAERVCVQLGAGLARWIGPGGYRALLHRALERERGEHPVLRTFSCHGGEDQMIAAAARDHGPDEVAAGMVAVVATMIDLLGRIVGEEMAVRLVEQTEPTSVRASAVSETEGRQHG